MEVTEPMRYPKRRPWKLKNKTQSETVQKKKKTKKKLLYANTKIEKQIEHTQEKNSQNPKSRASH